MEIGTNFVDRFGSDIALCIMKFVDDPADLVRTSAVSRSWLQFVISNCLCQKLCLRKVPAISFIARVVEVNEKTNELMEGILGHPSDSNALEREHQLYTCFLWAVSHSLNSSRESLAYAVGASSTDLYPSHSVVKMLLPSGHRVHEDSYWSSKGQNDPDMQEHLLFKLIPSISVVTEINIRPYRVSWGPVYSAMSVRFRMGHPKSKSDMDVDIRYCPSQKPTTDKYVWTYTSPEFPMKQESSLQVYKLPQPAVMIGGFLLIELFGSAQRDVADGLFYIRIGHVRFMTKAMRPEFDLEMEDSGVLVLKYSPDRAVIPGSMANELLEDEN